MSALSEESRNPSNCDAAPPRGIPAWRSVEWRGRLQKFGMFAGLLILLFAVPLYQLARLSFKTDLYSHALLVPGITLHLLWTGRSKFDGTFLPAGTIALIPAVIGAAMTAGYLAASFTNWNPALQDQLAMSTLAFVCFAWSGCLLLFGRAFFRQMLFPLLFLLFMVPFPAAMERAIESGLQHGSAEVAYIFVKLAGTPVLREGTQFRLPNITIEVAPECSGVRSSLALVMTAFLAAYFFLRTTGMKVLFGGIVVALGIIRNAFRIFVLAQLCVHFDPGFIHSPLHHRGGPVFFVVSLIPFFITLWLLRKWERKREARAGS